MNNAKILITGPTGQVAYPVALKLAETNEVWAAARFSDRKKRDASGTREAIRHLAEGGVVGIFPEGGIEGPSHTLRPFPGSPGRGIRWSRSAKWRSGGENSS